MRPFEFIIPGKPMGKQTARASGIRHPWARIKPHFYTPEDTKDYMRLVGTLCRQAMGNQDLLKHPKSCRVEITAYFYSKIPRNDKPVCKPDGDNIAKIIKDGMTKVAYEDDKQVTFHFVDKQWSVEDYVHVKVIPDEIQEK